MVSKLYQISSKHYSLEVVPTVEIVGTQQAVQSHMRAVRRNAQVMLLPLPDHGTLKKTRTLQSQLQSIHPAPS